MTALSAAATQPMAYVHGYWVYVPAQYDPSKPAALIVFNDGQPMKAEEGDVRATNVIDNLTFRREMPVAPSGQRWRPIISLKDRHARAGRMTPCKVPTWGRPSNRKRSSGDCMKSGRASQWWTITAW